MARRSATGKQEQAKRTRATTSKRSSKKASKETNDDDATTSHEQQDDHVSEHGDAPTEMQASQEEKSPRKTPKSPAKSTKRTPRRAPAKGKGKQKQVEQDEQEADEEPQAEPSSPAKRSTDLSMQSSVDTQSSEAEVAEAMAAEAIANATDEDIKASSSKFDEQAQKMYLVSPSHGKATPGRQRRRLQSRAANSPYNAGLSPRTPRALREENAATLEEERAQAIKSAEASTSPATPIANKSRALRLSQAPAQSPRSPAIRALQSIAGLFSPWSSRARHSAAFGDGGMGREEERVAPEEQASVIAEEAPSQEVQPKSEQALESEQAKEPEMREEPETAKEPEMAKEPEQSVENSENEEQQHQSPSKTALSTREIPNDQEAVSIYPQLPSAPIDIPSTNPQSSLPTADSAAQDSPVEQASETAEQSAAKVNVDVSFASPSPDRASTEQLPGENEREDTPEFLGEEMHLPSVPHSPPHSPSLYPPLPLASQANMSRPTSPPMESTPMHPGPGFVFSSPAQGGYKPNTSMLFSRDSPAQLPRSETFTFGRSRESSSAPGLPTYPRSTMSHKALSPLAKNYELLSRFFAEKAAAEEAGDNSLLHDEESGEGTHMLGGLTEVELAGCMRIIEQSFAQGHGADVQRLQSEALQRAQARSPSSVGGSSRSALGTNVIRTQHARMSRSPSLPLGAAASDGLSDQDYGFRSRPSTSFLAPASNASAADARVNRSLAHAFRPAQSTPSQRRHRPLYLGPGIGAGIASQSALGRSQVAQQRRAALQSHREMQQASLSKISAQDDHAESAPKRRKVQEEDARQSRAQPLRQPTSAASVETSTLFHKNAQSDAKEKQSLASDTPSVSKQQQRTLTADAMLSILRSSPSIPARSQRASLVGQVNGFGSSANAQKSGSVNGINLFNPYETEHRRIGKRPSMAPSSSLAAKEKERLKEERERRQREAQERKSTRKETTLELIERTAPLQRRGGRRIRVEPEDEEEEDEAPAKPAPLAPESAQRQGTRTTAAKENNLSSIADDRERKTREVQKRLDSLKAAKQAKSSDTATGQGVTASSSEEPSLSTASSTAAQAPASKLPSFSSTTSFAPKKPSPLSQAANSVLDSPSTSSEVSERDVPRSTTSSPSKPAPKPLFSFSDAYKSKTAAPLESANSQTGTSTFAAPEQKTPLKPAQTASEDNQTSSVSSPGIQAAKRSADSSSPQKQAIDRTASALPKFDFRLSVFIEQSPSTVTDDVSKKDAMSKSREALPIFDFGQGEGPDTDLPDADGKATAASKSSFNFSSPSAASSKDPQPPSSTGFSFAPLPKAAPTSQTEDSEGSHGTAEDGATPDSSAGKQTSALLSGVGEGEEDEETVHEVRCKTWGLEAGKWNDLGIGNLKIKKHQKTGKRRVLVRNEGNGKVTVNFRVLPTLKPNQEKNVVSFLGFTQEGKPMNYRCKIKTEDNAQVLRAALEREAKAES